MWTFDPETPWEIGQLVIVSDGRFTLMKEVVTVEHSDNETQYTLQNVRDEGEVRYAPLQ